MCVGFVMIVGVFVVVVMLIILFVSVIFVNIVGMVVFIDFGYNGVNDVLIGC